MDLKNKKVTVVGLGNSGVNAAILLRGIGARVWVTDNRDTRDVRNNLKPLKDRDIKYEIGKHTKDFVTGSSLVVISPGVEVGDRIRHTHHKRDGTWLYVLQG